MTHQKHEQHQRVLKRFKKVSKAEIEKFINSCENKDDVVLNMNAFVETLFNNSIEMIGDFFVSYSLSFAESLNKNNRSAAEIMDRITSKEDKTVEALSLFSLPTFSKTTGELIAINNTIDNLEENFDFTLLTKETFARIKRLVGESITLSEKAKTLCISGMTVLGNDRNINVALLEQIAKLSKSEKVDISSEDMNIFNEMLTTIKKQKDEKNESN